MTPPLDRVQQHLPDAVAVARLQDAGGFWPVEDAQGKSIGLVARTLPAAKDVVGYRGPTEALIAFDNELQIVSVGLLESTDTAEHVEAVIADTQFFRQFSRWKWGGPEADARIDAVSGATLTSLALAEGVLKRMGNDRPSLVFAQPLAVEEVLAWFPVAKSIRIDKHIAVIRDADQKEVGRVVRTGVLRDDIIGYQGPSELLLKISPDQRVEKVRLRHSFDNEPYVDYVRVEAGFWKLFENQSLEQLSKLDPEDAGIEGVSGATMTSLAVAETIAAAAATYQRQSSLAANKDKDRLLDVRWTWADIATLSILSLAALLSQFRLFHHRILRRLWLIAVLVVIGLWAGNLISLALVAGWSAEGIAWRLAPGLTAIAAVAMLIPPLTKGNPYCNHLCPHGAVQQLIKPRSESRWRWHPSRPVAKWLSRLPGLSLLAAYVVICLMPSTDLSSWEPFHAYLFRIAGWGAIAFAVITCLIALVIPMGYCRFGCPTGRLIDYLRRRATSDQIQKADYIAAAMLLLAIGIRYSA